MPTYVFENPETGEVVEVQQRIKDRHEHIDENGLEWKRVWTSLNFKTDEQIDPFSEKDYMRKTEWKRDSLGDMWDRSAELSSKRKERLGHDPVKKASLERYAQERKGLKHPKDK